MWTTSEVGEQQGDTACGLAARATAGEKLWITSECVDAGQRLM